MFLHTRKVKRDGQPIIIIALFVARCTLQSRRKTHSWENLGNLLILKEKYNIHSQERFSKHIYTLIISNNTMFFHIQTFLCLRTSYCRNINLHATTITANQSYLEILRIRLQLIWFPSFEIQKIPSWLFHAVKWTRTSAKV